MTQVGGVSLPGEVAARIALNELLLHGWDLARATDQPYQPDPAAIQTCLASLSMMYPAEDLVVSPLWTWCGWSAGAVSCWISGPAPSRIARTEPARRRLR
jgi:hypothetical protein